MNEEKDKPLEEEKIQSDDLFETTDKSLVVTGNKESIASLEEEIRRYEFFNKKKNDELDLERKKFDLRLHKIQRIIVLVLVIVLFTGSFFVTHYYDRELGMLMLGASLAALGVNVLNLKSLIKNE